MKLIAVPTQGNTISGAAQQDALHSAHDIFYYIHGAENRYISYNVFIVQF